ncbi:MAG: hypothetical protein CL678_19080 [Bdellovibrionaceae bacterium]|nr:hypothetical protein [Pseudobdellovibrionaceae bacterium]
MGPIEYLEMIEWIQNRFKCKLVIHFMDDWLDTAYTTGVFKFLRKKMLEKVNSLVKNSDATMAISNSMANAYQQRFNREFSVFHNGFSIDSIQKYNLKKSSETQKIITYFGSVFEQAQSESLRDLIEVTASIKNIQFKIVTPQYSIPLCKKISTAHNHVQIEEINGSDSQFFETISKSNLLLLPVNFDKESTQFIKYSMPTKLPGYLASKTPILVYGPKEIEQTSSAQEKKWGACVTERNPEVLIKEIHKCLYDSSFQSELLKNSEIFLKKEFDMNQLREDFQAILNH